MEKITLALAMDQPYGDQGKSVPPGTVIATIEFAEGIPPNLANAQFIKSGLATSRLVDARVLAPKSEKQDLDAPTGPMRNVLTDG